MSDEPQAERSFETTDARVRPLLAFTVLLTLVVVATFAVTSWMMSSFESRHDATSDGHPMREHRESPSGPALQADPTSELEIHRIAERERLEQYAWIDPATGVIRIPIERAMLLTAQRGLPVREAVPPSEGGGR